MKNTLQTILTLAVVMSGLMASGQPTPPYYVLVNGILLDCAPSSFVNIQTVQGTLPSLNYNVTVNSDCTFSDTLELESFTGYLQIGFPCNGMIEYTSVSYSVNAFEGTVVTLTLSCNSPEVDCLGVPGGSAIPGSPCDDNDSTTVNDVYTADCNCEGEVVNPTDCNADFWVLQGYTSTGNPNSPDSVIISPISNELWVWNLSSGGDGNYSFIWDFGDGTSSTEAFPTHVYPDGGPYLLCLTMTDGTGCTDTYCDTVAVDDDGLIMGMTMHPDELLAGASRSEMTLNVVAEQPLAVYNLQPSADVHLWPNPVQHEISIVVKGQQVGQMLLTILDMNGRVVSETRNTLTSGENNIRMDVNELDPGMYMLRIGNGQQSTVRRFIKN